MHTTCSMKFLTEATPRWESFLLKVRNTQNGKYLCARLFSTLSEELRDLVVTSSGGLDELEKSLDRFKHDLTSPLVVQTIDRCKNEAPTRRLLRFFSWSRQSLNPTLEEDDFNHAIRVFVVKKDHTAMEILLSDLRRENRALDKQTFGVVAETLVKLEREDEALGIFKNLDKFKCPQDSATVMAIVSALCAKGHAKKAEGVVFHHKSKIEGIEDCIYRCLLHGWCVQENVKEARRIVKEMRAAGVMPDLFCFNMLLRCLCKRNLKRNPSGLVPEALNVMMEMRTYNIIPTSISYNILLSCLGRTRRVKESCRVLDMMKNSGSSPDWVSYYLVVRVLYLSGRFGKGNKIVDEMIENGLVPSCKFYYDLIGILCGVERVNHAIELFERMKRSAIGGYGPVYDILVPRLCRGGDFAEGQELWDEAEKMGVPLTISRDILDPSITEVFKPSRKVEEEVKLFENLECKPQLQYKGKTKRKKKRKS